MQEEMKHTGPKFCCERGGKLLVGAKLPFSMTGSPRDGHVLATHEVVEFHRVRRSGRPLWRFEKCTNAPTKALWLGDRCKPSWRGDDL